MLEVFNFCIAFFASSIGAISGIGGGIIIKPVLDAFSVFGISTITFLSGCTVLSMSGFSLILNKKNRVSLELKISGLLATGSIIGGLLGKFLFNIYLSNTSSANNIKILQSIILIFLTFGVFIFSLNKKKIKPHNVENIFVILIIGLVLGVTGSFLGIGGGPINLLVLFLFFSMDAKTSAINSLFIIFFSQLSSLLLTIFSNSIPDFSLTILILMILGGISGATTGMAISKRVSTVFVERLYILILISIMILCVKNIL